MDSQSNTLIASDESNIKVNSGTENNQKGFQGCHCCGLNIFNTPSSKRFVALDGFRELSALAHGSFTNNLHGVIYLCRLCHQWCKRNEAVLDLCSKSRLRMPV